MTEERRAELQALSAKAAVGDWYVFEDALWIDGVCVAGPGATEFLSYGDMLFIEGIRTALPEALARVHVVEKEARRLRTIVRGIQTEALKRDQLNAKWLRGMCGRALYANSAIT